MGKLSVAEIFIFTLNLPCTGKFTACLSACDFSWGLAELRFGNQRFLLQMVDKQPVLKYIKHSWVYLIN